ncbi:MAG: hypothetical protein GX053_03635 [Tissierella sp.]|nr:hypothetical protein [Tissierella sp.]
MKIVLNEIKKIFELKMIAIMLLINFILYFLFTSFHINHFPNGRPELDHYNIHLEMLENYGRDMDEEEFAHFKEVYENEVERANQYLQEDELAREEGISTYEAFRSIGSDRLGSYIMFEERVDLFWELQARESLIDDYETTDLFIERLYEKSNEQQRQRIDEVVHEDRLSSIFPNLVFNNYTDYIGEVCLAIFLSIMFMLSPIYLRDGKNNMNDLQYTSKIGRNLFKKKALGAIIATFIIITLELGVYFLIYTKNNTGMFLNSKIISIFHKRIFWYNLTFIQYIVLTLVGIYVMGFVIALMVSLISSLAPNYIATIAIQIPLVFFTLVVFIPYLIKYIALVNLPKYSRGISYLGLVIVSLILMGIRWRREKLMDIA